MDAPLSQKIRTVLEKMTYFYGQSRRKKAAILPTKPHTRLHLNHVVMTLSCPLKGDRGGLQTDGNGFSYAKNCHVPSIASQGSFSSASALDELGRHSTMLPGVDVLPSWR